MGPSFSFLPNFIMEMGDPISKKDGKASLCALPTEFHLDQNTSASAATHPVGNEEASTLDFKHTVY